MSTEQGQLNESDAPDVAAVVSSMAGMLIDGERRTLSAMQFGSGVAGLFTAFFEMLWRRNFGSLYLNPMAWIINLIVITILFYVGIFAHLGEHWFNMHGVIGVEVIAPLYYILSAYHAKRIWYLVENPMEELDSGVDGDTWPAVERLPKGTEWRRARVIYEPLLTIAIGITLYLTRVFNLTALVFFIVGGLALFMKAFLMWCMSWYAYRKGLDSEYRSKLMASMRRGAPAPKMMGPLPLPKQMSPAAQPRKEAA